LISNNEHFFKKILMSDNFHIGGRPHRNWRGQMKQELELEVWRLAQQTSDSAAFVRLVEEAVDSFKRDPGYDPNVRLHASGVGVESIRVLRDVMKRHDIYTGPSADYVELRSRLRMHLRDQLQMHLMKSGQASDEMKEDQLGRDLGL
jgi:hypothetical protein